MLAGSEHTPEDGPMVRGSRPCSVRWLFRGKALADGGLKAAENAAAQGEAANGVLVPRHLGKALKKSSGQTAGAAL